MANYFTSDAHFGHYDLETNRGIITFERTNFMSIEEHDNFLMERWFSWSERLKREDRFWFLGDFGDLKYLYLFNLFNDKGIETHFLLGNHDNTADIPEIEKYVYQVHQYPVYLSNRLVVSHEPVGTWDSVINIHGHLHGSIIDKPNYINASIHVANYKLITEKNIANVYSKIPKWCMRFLYEPYADMYKFVQPKEDIIMDRNGKIDLSASRLLMKINTNAREKVNDTYQPYTGTFGGPNGK